MIFWLWTGRALTQPSLIETILKSVQEITIPLIGSTLTPVVVFLPLSLLSGITGVFFRSLATTLSVALLTSLVLALLFTRIVAMVLLRTPLVHQQGSIFDPAIDGYSWILKRALARPWLVPLLVLGLLGASWQAYTRLGSEFLPSFDEGGFVLDYVAPPGTSLIETDLC